MIRNITGIFIGMVLFSIPYAKAQNDCNDVVSIHRFDLDTAWIRNDTVRLLCYLQLLQKDIPYSDFCYGTAEWCGYTNFCYGGLDCETKWDTVSEQKKKVMKRNILAVLNVYVNSCAFLNKRITFEDSLYIQDKYWSSSEFLSDEILIKIKEELDSLCRKKRKRVMGIF